jgi:glycosyltransferase involved in cell wall biosynthesis
VLTPPGNERALAAAIDSVAFDPGLRQRLGAAARSQVAERHGPEAHYRAILEIYGHELEARGECEVRP